MTYGSVPRRHFRKIDPWVLRLETATAGLVEDLGQGNRFETVRSLEDVWFWVGRTMCEVLSSQSELAANPALAQRSERALVNAALVSASARKFLGAE